MEARILEALDIGVIFIDSSKRVRYLNRAAKEALRCAREADPEVSFAALVAALGFDPLEVRPRPPAAGGFLRTRRQDGPGPDPRARRSPIGTWRQECRLCGDFYDVWVTRLAAAADPGGVLVCLQRGGDIQQRRQELIAALRNASHELRTPVAAISNALELLGSERLGPLGEKRQRLLDLAERNVARLRHVIETLLEASQLAAGRLNLELEAARLDAVAAEVVREQSGDAQEQGVELKLETGASLPAMAMDTRRMYQAIAALVANGIKFTPAGGRVTVRLELKAWKELLRWLRQEERAPAPMPAAAYAVITVADTGGGIDSEVKEALFLPFVRLESPGVETPPGPGLGLYLAKTVVEAHGGRIWVGEESPTGAEFHVLLPVLGHEGQVAMQAEAAIQRARERAAPLSLVLLRFPMEANQQMLHETAAAVQRELRQPDDRAQVLDPEEKVLAVLAEVGSARVEGLVRRIGRALRSLGLETRGEAGGVLEFASVTYPEEAHSGAAMVAGARKRLAGPGAGRLWLGQQGEDR